MHAKICLTYTALLFLTAKGSMDDPGPQTFVASTPEPLPAASPSPQYETKEVIVYLTPSQIRALQTGQGVLEPIFEPQPKPVEEQPNPELEQTPQPQNEYDNDEEFKKEMEHQKAYLASHPNIAEAIKNIQRQKNNDPKPVKEPSSQEQPEEEPAQFSWYPKEANNYFDPVTDKPQENKYYAPSSERPESIKYYNPSTERPQEKKYYAPSTERAEPIKYYNPSTERPQENKYYAPSTERAEPIKYYNPSTERPEINKFYSPSSEKPEIIRPHSYNYFNVYNEKKGDNINIKIFHPAPKDKLRDALEAKELEAQKNPPLIKQYKLVPYEFLNKKLPDFEPIQEQRNRALFTPAQPAEQSRSPQYGQENSNEKEQNFDEELLKLKYESRYNDQKQAIEIQNLMKKQKTAAQIEAIAKAPPVEVHREVSITKHQPVHIIKHVQVPVPQPYFVRVPEPFEVKVPQPYPVPLEIIRHVPVEIVKTEKIEVEKPVPYEVMKRVPVPVEKKVYVKVDKPYFVEKIVPVEIRKEIPVKIPIHKPQKLTILRHIWEHN